MDWTLIVVGTAWMLTSVWAYELCWRLADQRAEMRLMVEHEAELLAENQDLHNRIDRLERRFN